MCLDESMSEQEVTDVVMKQMLLTGQEVVKSHIPPTSERGTEHKKASRRDQLFVLFDVPEQSNRSELILVYTAYLPWPDEDKDIGECTMTVSSTKSDKRSVNK